MEREGRKGVAVRLILERARRVNDWADKNNYTLLQIGTSIYCTQKYNYHQYYILHLIYTNIKQLTNY